MTTTSAKTKNPLAQAPLVELAAELGRRRAALPKLLTRRHKLIGDLELVESQIIALQQIDSQNSTIERTVTKFGSASLSSIGKKSKRGLSMAARIAQVLGAEPMRPVEIAEQLVAQGLHPGSKSLPVQVSTNLAKFDEFTRLARGQWVRI